MESQQTQSFEVKRRNKIVLFIQGALMNLGFSFISPSGVTSVFLETFTGSVFVASLANAVRMSGLHIGQMFYGTRAHRIKNVPRWLVSRSLTIRILFFSVVPLLLLRINPVTVGYIFLVIFGLRYLVEGGIDLVYRDLFCRLVEPEARGSLIGSRTAVGSALALLSSTIIALILASNMHINDQYALIYGIGISIFILTTLVLSFVKDKPRPEAENKKTIGFWALVKMAFAALQSRQLNRPQKNYVAFTIFRILQIFANAGILLSLVLIKRAGNLTPAQVGMLIFAQTIGRFVGGFVWGRISKKLGNKRTIIITQIITIPIRIISILILALANPPAGLSWALAIMAGLIGTSFVGSTAYLMDTLPEESRTFYYSIDGLVSLPLAFVNALFGLLAEAFGFLPLQIGTMILGLLSIVVAVVMLKPRERLLEDAVNKY